MRLRRILASARERFSSAPPDSAAVSEYQSGAIPFVVHEGVVVFLLVTSRRTGRWIFPKGRLVAGAPPWQSAAREALEEAGVVGSIDPVPAGTYRTWKMRGLSRLVIEVELYPLRVEHQIEDWHETGQRHRHWAALPEVRRLVTDKRLIEVVRALEAAHGIGAPVQTAEIARIAR